MKRAIGFAGGQVGDCVIQTVPAKAFKQQFPDVELTFAISSKYKDILPLFFGNKNIDSFHIWEGYDDWPTPPDREYISFRQFEYVFSPTPTHSRPDWYNYYHYAEENCIRYGLNPPSDLSYDLVKWFPNLDGYQNVVTLSLFPSKGEQLDKTMPIEECEQLCISLKKMGYIPIQLGGKFEVKLQNAFAPSFSILEAAQVLTSSKLHITADTAFSSIAAGYKHPTVGFYGINYPNMTDCWSHLPPNPNASYIKNRNPQSLKSEELLEVVKQRL